LSLPRISPQARLIAAGDSARDAGDMDRALQIYRYAQRLNSHDAEPVLKESQILYRRGKNLSAEAAARHAMRLNPSDTECQLLLAQTLLAQGKQEPAVRALEQAEASGSLNKMVYRLLGDLYAQTGSTEKSDYEFRKVLELDSSDVHAAINVAAHMAAQSPQLCDEAIKLCKKVAPEQPSAQLQLQLGLMHLQRNHSAEAVECFKQARDADPHDSLAFEMLAVASGARQDWTGAQDYAQSFADLDPGNVNPRSLLAWSTYAAGDLQEARGNFQKAISMLPNSKLLHELYALVLIDSRRYQDAAKELCGTSIADSSQGTHSIESLTGDMNKIMLLACEAKYEQAAKDADLLLEEHSGLAPLNSLAAYCHLNAGSLQTARKLAVTATELDPHDCMARIVLAKIAREHGDYAEALRQLEVTGVPWRQTSIVLTAKARTLYESGDFSGAQATSQLALQIAPSCIPAKEVLALSLLKQNNCDGAILFLKELVGRSPKDISVRMALAEALEKKGDLEAAETAYSNASKINPKSVEPVIGLAILALKQHHVTVARKLTEQALGIDASAVEKQSDLAVLVNRKLQRRLGSSTMPLSP
jgi:tetratricopeptide (TPR) repeat protein